MPAIDRARAAALGRATRRILAAGDYATPRGVVVIREALARAVAATRDYPPEVLLPPARPGARPTRFEVCNATTLAAAHRLVAAGHDVAALNFASATHPGGGFCDGARAQEESLAWSSGLYACLAGRPMYAHHDARRDPMYTPWVIHAPAVPVFRDDAGALLDAPFACAFLTAAAVNAKVVLGRDPTRRPAIRAAMAERVARVLAVAAAHGHDALVLGAWGCGAFGNDPREVATLFHAALTGDFRNQFAEVVFAIVDWSEERRFIGPFQDLFAT